MRDRLFLLVFGFITGVSLPLSGQITMGQWRTHLPYQYCTLVEATDDRVYCSTTGGLFYYNLEDHLVEKISKIDGLSDNGVSAMRWSEELETLILAYENSNLDIIRNNTIVNLPDIMKKQITGDKSIYDIYYIGTRAYLSTGFGIVVINLERDEISETYLIGDNGQTLKVNQLSSDGSYLYAATDQGIRRALLSDPFLVDYNAWELLTDIPGSGGAFGSVACFENHVFASSDDPAGEQDQVYYSSGMAWIPYPYFTGNICHEILNQGNFLSLVDDTAVHLINTDFLVVQQMFSPKPRSAVLDTRGDLWLADNGWGLMTNQGGGTWTITPDGPYSTSVFDMESAEGVLHAVVGGISGSWNNLWNTATLETLADDEWSWKHSWEDRDLIKLAIDPDDPYHVYTASWGMGILEYRGDEITRYNESNSSLQTIIPGPYVRIGGVALDPDGNLWMTNSNVAEPISVRKADGTWKSFRVDNLITSFNALGDILVSSSGQKWVIVPRGNGLFAMDDNRTIEDISDDIYKKVSVVDKFGKVITNDVYSFAEDHHGNLWLGTNQGVLVMYSPYRLFSDGSIYAQEILIPRNDGSGFADPLLGTQVITSIEVDGANRKWLGTSGGGAYLVSEDGFSEINHFNTSNSPLLSNTLTDICVDGISGEVFFGTDKGIISYKGEALQGSPAFNHVVVYPNPVRENFDGNVAIKGLMERSTVKITDMSGNLVFETESLGGQAIWDGKNLRGERVATGVYMIYLSSGDGTQSHVTKLLFIH
ncbi:MAG: two-component regulator propeller domain-containing protein [Bacteroidales bacterium]|nr:two-component regulator propeller domain-containing protein [Bacteroidales bacterium]